MNPKPHIMKTLKKPILLATFLAISSLLYSQMAVVAYMKVKPENNGKYIEVEKAWKKIHEARVKAGEILSWTFYENMYAGADEAYQYAIVTVYKDFAASEKPTNWDEIGKAAYPNFTQKDWDDLLAKTGESRVMSTVEAFYQVVDAGVAGSKPPLYMQISCMNVTPGNEGNYVNLEKDYYKPMHAEVIKNGGMEGWGIWWKYPGNYKDYQYVAVDLYSSPEQIASGNYNEVFKKIFPSMKMEDLGKKTNDARNITEAYMWKMIDDVRAK
jgi:hypothetical protein